MFRKAALFALLLGVVAVGTWAYLNRSRFAAAPAPNYQAAPGFDYKVSLFAEHVGQVSRIRVTPDGKTLLVATLAENIYAFNKDGNEFVRQEKPFFSLKTGLPGFPPEESGLSGMVLGAGFEKNGDIFLLHTARAGEEVLKNRITRITFVRRGDEVFGENPTQIFEANTDTELSHQIQGGAGVMIAGVPHLLFNIGDAVNAKNARDLSKEAGKVMLIGRDGGLPLGPRPYWDRPKIQAVGLRNAFDIALNPYDPERRFAIGDTGTDRFDRFIYGNILEPEATSTAPIDLQWDGTNDSLARSVPDLNTPGSPDMVLHRWDPTETVTDIVFHEAAGTPAVLMNVWGQTGSTERGPGRKILWGTLSGLGNQPKLELRDFVVRSDAGVGKLGHPLGLAADPTMGVIYFGDILEGNIYKVEPIKK